MKNKNETMVAFIIFMLLTIGLSFGGISEIIKKITYVETLGTYSRSESYHSTDSDGETITKYKWYYDYVVGGSVYTMQDSEHDVSSPSRGEEIVLYDTHNPGSAVLKRNHQGAIMLISGIWCGIFALLMCPIKNTEMDNRLSKEEKRKKSAKMMAYIWFMLCGLFLLVIFFSADFDLSMIFGPLLPASLVIIFMFFMGFLFFVDTGKPIKYYQDYNVTSKGKNDSSYDGLDNDLLKYNASDGINNDIYETDNFFGNDDNSIK